MAENNSADVKKLPFERAIEELESIVKRLEEGKVPLEESVAIYERGEALKKRARSCCARLKPASKGLPWMPTVSRPAARRWTWIDHIWSIRDGLLAELPAGVLLV